MRVRFARQTERLSDGTRHHPSLSPGDRVMVQNQSGPKPNRWDRSGVVVEVKPHGQHLVRMDGSRRVTLRNRQFVRKVEPLVAADRGTAPSPRSESGAPSSQPASQHVPVTRATRACPPVLGNERDVPQLGKQMECQQQQEPTDAPPVEVPTQPETPGRDEPAPRFEPRRSSRTPQQPERLQLRWGDPSYVDGVACASPTAWQLQ